MQSSASSSSPARQSKHSLYSLGSVSRQVSPCSAAFLQSMWSETAPSWPGTSAALAFRLRGCDMSHCQDFCPHHTPSLWQRVEGQHTQSGRPTAHAVPAQPLLAELLYISYSLGLVPSQATMIKCKAQPSLCGLWTVRHRNEELQRQHWL